MLNRSTTFNTISNFFESHKLLPSGKRLENLLMSSSFFFWIVLGGISLLNPTQLNLSGTNRLFYFLFLFSAFFYFKTYFKSVQPSKIEDIIWTTFTASAFMFVCLLCSDLIPNLISISTFQGVKISYHFRLGITTIFLANSLYAFKALSLYRRNSYVIWIWNLFEPLLLFSLFLVIFFPYPSHPLSICVGLSLLVLGLLIIPHLKWVAYLNLTQKLTSLLLFILQTLIAAVFLHELYEFSWLSTENNFQLPNDMSRHIFIGGVIMFILSYSSTCTLVLLFNLPTSSVTEQKIGQLDDLHKLISNTQTAEHDIQISHVLLENCISPHLAEAAWVEIYDENSIENTKETITKYISQKQAGIIKNVIKRRFELTNIETTKIKDINELLTNKEQKLIHFRSVLIIPLYFKEKKLGLLGLVKRLPRKFNRDLIKNFQSWAEHASVALLNHQYMVGALENERSQEKVKIAKEAQEKLFPTKRKWDTYPHFQFSGSCIAADDIGGDYYDIYEISTSLTAVVIADVCGHGTEAAFSANQLKGIFKALVQTVKGPGEFLYHANNALCECLERGKFVTLSILYINSDKKEIKIANAGHCPTLKFSSKEGKADFIKSKKKLFLGSIKGLEYKNFIEEIKIPYQSGDSLLLFTDGIYETTSTQKEQFGLQRLKRFLELNASMDPPRQLKKLRAEVNKFSRDTGIHDDHTCVSIKFH